MTTKSPTARTLEYARAHYWHADICERYNAFTRTRHDLFGFIDLIVLADGELIGVQATSASNHAARRTKILASPYLGPWLDCGGKVEVWSWGKKGAAGKRKLWTLRRERITAEETP